MADRSGTLGLLALGVAGAIAVPLVLGNVYTAWRESAARTAPPPPPPIPIAPAAPAPAPVAEPVEPPEPHDRPLWPRAVDALVFGGVEGGIDAPVDQRDVDPAAPHRVDLARAAVGGLATAAKVDLDRDGRWDERWSMGDVVTREVSPADDGRYTERYRWEEGDWVRLDTSSNSNSGAGG